MKTQYEHKELDLRKMSDVEIAYNLVGDKEAASVLVETMREVNPRGITKSDFLKVKGIGDKTAEIILFAIEIGKRSVVSKKEPATTIQSSLEGFTAMRDVLCDLPNEEFWIALINRANKVMKRMRVFVGGTSGVYVDVKIILNEIIKHKASGVIAFHNHPSGSLAPSREDDFITKKLSEACKLLDTRLLDHIIIAGDRYYSYTDEGKI